MNNPLASDVIWFLSKRLNVKGENELESTAWWIKSKDSIANKRVQGVNKHNTQIEDMFNHTDKDKKSLAHNRCKEDNPVNNPFAIDAIWLSYKYLYYKRWKWIRKYSMVNYIFDETSIAMVNKL